LPSNVFSFQASTRRFASALNRLAPITSTRIQALIQIDQKQVVHARERPPALQHHRASRD
jgi:hypothetical protein